MDGTVLVTGATGNTGAPLVELLARRGMAVRAMVRTEDGAARLRGEYLARYGTGAVEVAVADFERPDQLAGALKDVAAVYLVTPSSERAQAQQERFVELAGEAGVTHVVKLSQLAADECSPVRFLRYHAAVERRIRELGLEYTFLRPNLFLQGLLAMAGTVRDQGRVFAPIGQARISAIDVRDIADVAAAALTEPGHRGATYTLTGPAAVTHAEIAAALTAATGREVEFVDVPPAAFAEMLHGVLPDWQVNGLVEDYAHYARGEAAEVNPAVPQVTGRPARDLAGFVHEYAGAFR